MGAFNKRRRHPRAAHNQEVEKAKASHNLEVEEEPEEKISLQLVHLHDQVILNLTYPPTQESAEGVIKITHFFTLPLFQTFMFSHFHSFKTWHPLRRVQRVCEIYLTFQTSIIKIFTFSHTTDTQESEEGVWEIAQFCPQLTSLYLESPASPILAILPHWTNVRLIVFDSSLSLNQSL